MTVIASFSIDRCPILLGDLLVSSDEISRPALNIPTIGKVSQIFPEGLELVPTGLRQKIAVMNDNLALAWSGDMISAQIVIKQLLSECRERENWSLADLKPFFFKPLLARL